MKKIKKKMLENFVIKNFVKFEEEIVETEEEIVKSEEKFVKKLKKKFLANPFKKTPLKSGTKILTYS